MNCNFMVWKLTKIYGINKLRMFNLSVLRICRGLKEILPTGMNLPRGLKPDLAIQNNSGERGKGVLFNGSLLM